MQNGLKGRKEQKEQKEQKKPSAAKCPNGNGPEDHEEGHCEPPDVLCQECWSTTGDELPVGALTADGSKAKTKAKPKDKNDKEKKENTTIVVIVGEEPDFTKVYRVPDRHLSDGTIRLLKNIASATQEDRDAYDKDWKSWRQHKYEIKHQTGERGGVLVGVDWE